MDDLVERLRDGLIEHPKRWSGDTHADLGGSVDYAATDNLMDKAAARIEALEAENAALREALRAIAGVVPWPDPEMGFNDLARAALAKTEGEG